MKTRTLYLIQKKIKPVRFDVSIKKLGNNVSNSARSDEEEVVNQLMIHSTNMNTQTHHLIFTILEAK